MAATTTTTTTTLSPVAGMTDNGTPSSSSPASSSLESSATSSSSVSNTFATSNSNNPQTEAPIDDGFPFTAVIIISAVFGAVVLSLIIFFLLLRKYRRSHLPPSLPKLDAYGLPRQDSTLRPTPDRYQPWVTTEPADPHSDDPPSVLYVPTEEDPLPAPSSPRHPAILPPEESAVTASDQDVYVNVGAVRPDSSSSGVYITCANHRPESVPMTVAPGFRGRLPASPRAEGVLESLYMPMDLGGSTRGAGVQEDLQGIYVVPGEAEFEVVYSNPDQPPLPCFSANRRRPYVNVPESDPRPQQKENEEEEEETAEAEQGEEDTEDYQNLCVAAGGHVYGNIPHNFSSSGSGVHKKRNIIRSESLKNMATPQKVSEALQGCPSSEKSSGKSCGGGQTPSQTGANLHKAMSMSQVPSSSSKLVSPNAASKWPKLSLQGQARKQSLPSLSQETDSGGDDSDGESYVNVKSEKKNHYVNAPDKKEDPDPKRNLGNGSASGIPTLVHKKPGAGSKKSDSVNTKPGPASSKPGPASSKPTVSHKPKVVSSKPGTVGTKPEMASCEARTVSAKPVIAGKKPGGTGLKKSGTVGSKVESVSVVKPKTIGAKPKSVGAKPGTVNTKAGRAGTKPGVANPKEMKTEQLVPEKAENGCSKELMQILAKRRQNDGDS